MCNQCRNFTLSWVPLASGFVQQNYLFTTFWKLPLAGKPNSASAFKPFQICFNKDPFCSKQSATNRSPWPGEAFYCVHIKWYFKCFSCSRNFLRGLPSSLGRVVELTELKYSVVEEPWPFYITLSFVNCASVHCTLYVQSFIKRKYRRGGRQPRAWPSFPVGLLLIQILSQLATLGLSIALLNRCHLQFLFSH